LETLTEEQWTQLDQVIQDQVLAAREGLQKALMSTTDLIRHLMAPLISQAVNCLSNHLPITDVAQVELAVEEQEGAAREADTDVSEHIHNYYHLAAPALLPKSSKQPSGVHSVVAAGGARAGRPGGSDSVTTKDRCFLLVPASDAGKRYGEQAQRLLTNIQLVNVPGQADLMFCRELAELKLEDLDRILRACRTPYDETVNVPQSSPHARFDVQDWMPLDP
jgi:hypothetical protein